MSAPLKVALVGCGKIADCHVEEIRKLDVASLVAVCELEPLIAEQLAVRYKIPACYSDFGRMLASEAPDVVHITTPPQSHYALAAQALDAGCHVYVEKPLTLDCLSAQRLIQHAVRTDRKLTINYWPNFDPAALAFRQLIDQGVAGDPVHIESVFGYDLSGVFGQAVVGNPAHWVHDLPGKLFHNNLDHILNKIVPFLPEDQPEIQAFGYRRRDPVFDPVADALLDELRFMVRAGGITAYGTLSSHSRPVGHSLRFYGSKRTIHLDCISGTITMEPEPLLPGALGRLLRPFTHAGQYLKQGGRNVMRFARSDYHYFAGMRRLISLFYQSILQDSPPPIPYHQILRTGAMMDQIFSQLHQHVEVA